ncbi:ribonuclease HII [Oscillibacter sp.]|uniref:ribonuclease HII n=1 Tax=Oscillibacter sp. TaxID=1945593 RepID=UPI002897941D|nr:ribonuclease HII [Oscillibacter sp.]
MAEMEHPWSIEEQCFADGYETVCGADEAGAGPLAGPVYAAAVILPRGLIIDGLNDSKTLTEKKREKLFEIIRAEAEDYCVAWVEAEEIDAIDILNARMKAMQLAIDGLKKRPDFALIDGNRDRGSLCAITAPHETVVGGDGKSASIAAASILAKVSRDRFVTEVLDKEYPLYQFAKHKGYGTKLHYGMLDAYGPCPAHRRSFLKKWERGRP